MFLIEHGPAGKIVEHGAIDNRDLTLGRILEGVEVDSVWVNRYPKADWPSYVPVRGDKVEFYSQIGTPIQWIQGIIMLITIIASVLQATVFAPRRPKISGDRSDAFGTTGFRNTTGQGVPILRAYGYNRIYPHVIASSVRTNPDHKSMVGKWLGCVGASDDNGWEDLTDILINDIPVEQFEGVIVHKRLGTPDQAIIPGFEDVPTAWLVNQEVPYDEDNEQGSPIVYTTKANNPNVSVLTFSFPSGLYRINASGKRKPDVVAVDIWQRRADPSQTDADYVRVLPSYEGEGGYVPSNGVGYEQFHFEDSTQSGTFRDVVIDHAPIFAGYAGDPTEVYIKIQISHAGDGPHDEPHATTLFLYNVEEIIYTTRNYPNRVLLGLENLPSRQIPNLESMKVSVLAKCQRVKEYDSTGTNYTLKASRKRCWNTAHFLSNQRIGMGYEIDESEIDTVQWAYDAQAYYDEQVQVDVKDAQGNIISTYDETRDYCDIIIADRKWDWEHVKRMVGEGRAILFPSNGKWKWAVDKPGSPDLLLSEPGNIIEGSITQEISPPDKYWNQIIGEYRDETDNYQPAITPAINADDLNLIPAPPASVVQEAVSYETITRRSQAMRENMVMIKRQFLEKRRWTFTSPQTAIVKEPLDLDWLCERVLGDEGCFTGYIGDGSTTTDVILDRPVEIRNAQYLLVIQHRDGSMAESRIVSTGEGDWIKITVESAFTKIPARNDIYALGVIDVDHVVTRCREMTINAEGRVEQLRTEYRPEVYTPDPMFEGFNSHIFPIVSMPPLPLRDAYVSNHNTLKADGSWGLTLNFDVTPGEHRTASVNTGVSWPVVWLPVSLLPQQYQGPSLQPGEPPRNSFQRYYFNGAYWQLTSGNGAGYASRRKIIDFDPNPVSILGTLSYSITLEGSQPPGSITGENCTIEWDRWAETRGFKLEISQDALAWTLVTKKEGFHQELDGGDQGGSWYYRFTPFNVSGIENNVARLVKGVAIQGDTVAPPAPISVLGFATTSFITIEATFQLPMALDFAGIEILARQFGYSGVPPHKVYQIGNLVLTRLAATRENGTSGTIAIRKTVDIRNVYVYPPAGQAWDAEVRAYDYSGNKSAAVMSNDFYPQKFTAADIQA